MWACSRRRRGFTCPSPQDTPLPVGIHVLLAFAIRIYIEKYFSQFLFKGRGQILLYGFGPFTGQIRRITSNKFGMYDPTPSHHKRLKMDQICKEVFAVSPIYNQIILYNYCTIVIISADGPAVVGPMPTITDSLFSLIIFIYVMITFLYLFYGFCWIEPPKLTEEQKKELAKQVKNFGKN